MQLDVASLSETVTVTGESPVVDVKNTNIQTNITEQMLKDIPNSRDIWTVIGQAPGFTVSNLDVGGSRAGTQTGYSAFGYSGQVRSRWTASTRPRAPAAPGFYYDYGSFQELQLSADGNDASSTTPGVQLNAIVKSGGNKFKGDFYYDYENSTLQGRNVTDELRRLGVGEGTRMSLYRDPNVSHRRPDHARQVLVLRVGARSADRRHDRRFSGRRAERLRVRDAADQLHLQAELSAVAEQSARSLHPVGPEVPAASRREQHGYLDTPQRQDSWSWAANVEWNDVSSSRFVQNARYSTFGYDWPDERVRHQRRSQRATCVAG